MAAADPIARSMAASIAASTRWAHEADRTPNGQRGQRGLRAKFERDLDPHGELAPAELAKRVDNALKAHMTRIAMKSRAARAARRLAAA